MEIHIYFVNPFFHVYFTNFFILQVPSCLIIQMPRFGKDYKMYPRILPSMVLDVTDVIEDCKLGCELIFTICGDCYF